MRKILLSIAPVSHTGIEIPSEVNNPVIPEQVASEVIACARLGVSMVHLHVRDDKGEQTSDLKWFSKTLDLIRQESDIIIQGSTGGPANLSLEERCVSLDDPRVQVASLNMGSANLNKGVYINTLPDIRFWAKKMQGNKVVPEMEIFDLSMIDSVVKISREGLAEPPFSFNFCMGFENAIQPTADHLYRLKSAVPEGSHWGLIHENMKDLSLLATAAGMGASVLRVGFEDSFYYGEGKMASTNVVLVEKLAELLAMIDVEPMSVEEAKALIGVKK